MKILVISCCGNINDVTWPVEEEKVVYVAGDNGSFTSEEDYAIARFMQDVTIIGEELEITAEITEKLTSVAAEHSVFSLSEDRIVARYVQNVMKHLQRMHNYDQ